MRCSACGTEGTSFHRGRRPSGEVVYLCPACSGLEKEALEPTGEGCGCRPPE